MNEPELLILIGGGGHAKVVLESAESVGRFGEIVFLDDALENAALARLGVRCLGAMNRWQDFDQLMNRIDNAQGHIQFFGAMGDNAQRKQLTESLQTWIGNNAGNWFDQAQPIAVVQHASANVSARSQIEDGTLIGPGAVVNADVRIDAGAIVNSGAVVEHDCTIGAFAHIAPGAVLGGAVQIGAETLVGLGARILPGINVGAQAVIAAGAVVCADVADWETVRGIPAR